MVQGGDLLRQPYRMGEREDAYSDAEAHAGRLRRKGAGQQQRGGRYGGYGSRAGSLELLRRRKMALRQPDRIEIAGLGDIRHLKGVFKRFLLGRTRTVIAFHE